MTDSYIPSPSVNKPTASRSVSNVDAPKETGNRSHSASVKSLAVNEADSLQVYDPNTNTMSPEQDRTDENSVSPQGSADSNNPFANQEFGMPLPADTHDTYDKQTDTESMGTLRGSTGTHSSFSNKRLSSSSGFKNPVHSPTGQTEASHISIDSYAEFAENWKYENGRLLTQESEKYELNPNDGAVRNKAGKPANTSTGQLEPNNKGTLLTPSAVSTLVATDLVKTDNTAKDVQLRPASESQTKPFKPLDWVDRHFIWMHERTHWAALAWLTIVGTYMNLRAHFRHGMSYNANFAQQKTPDKPINGVYFQDKQSNRAHSLRHAIRAMLGEPIGHSAKWFNKWCKSLNRGPDGPSASDVVEHLIDNIEIPEKQYEMMEVTRDSELTHSDFKERIGAVATRLEDLERDRALVSIDTNSGREWVAFRKNSETKKWTLIDASAFIINAKRNGQPEISPEKYLEHQLERGNLKGFAVVY